MLNYFLIQKEVWFLNWLSHPNLASIEESVTVGFDVYIFSSYYDLGLFLLFFIFKFIISISKHIMNF